MYLFLGYVLVYPGEEVTGILTPTCTGSGEQGPGRWRAAPRPPTAAESPSQGEPGDADVQPSLGNAARTSPSLATLRDESRCDSRPESPPRPLSQPHSTFSCSATSPAICSQSSSFPRPTQLCLNSSTHRAASASTSRYPEPARHTAALPGRKREGVSSRATSPPATPESQHLPTSGAAHGHTVTLIKTQKNHISVSYNQGLNLCTRPTVCILMK